MDELDIAFYVLVPLAILSIALFFYYLKLKKVSKEEFGIARLEKQDKEEEAEEKELEGIEEDVIFSDTDKFWSIENIKARARHKVFNIFRRNPTRTKNRRRNSLQSQVQYPTQPPIPGRIPIKEISPSQDFFQPEATLPESNKSESTKPLIDLDRDTGTRSPPKSKLMKMKVVGKSPTFSKLNNISKKYKGEYLNYLIEKEKEDKKKSKKSDPMSRLETLPDKKSKIINRLKKLHH